jgi:hypothetical protein
VKRLLVIVAAMLAFSAGTAVATPNKAERNAAQECREERGDTAASREAFRNKYGTNGNKKNAFGKCVSQKARED